MKGSEVLREMAHRGCQQPQGRSVGHVNILPLILSNILQKEPDKKCGLLIVMGSFLKFGNSAQLVLIPF